MCHHDLCLEEIGSSSEQPFIVLEGAAYTIHDMYMQATWPADPSKHMCADAHVVTTTEQTLLQCICYLTFQYIVASAKVKGRCSFCDANGMFGTFACQAPIEHLSFTLAVARVSTAEVADSSSLRDCLKLKQAYLSKLLPPGAPKSAFIGVYRCFSCPQLTA